MRLRPVLVPSAYRHSSSRFCSRARSRCSRTPAVTNCWVKPMRKSTSLSMSSRLVSGQRLAQFLVVGLAAHGEVGRQVIIWIAVAIGAGNPDLLAADPFTDGLEH